MANVWLVGSFGENLRRLRKAAGIRTSKHLAELIDRKPSVVSRWETDTTGLPEGPTLLLLAKTVGCTVDDLLVGVDAEYDALVSDLRGRTEATTIEPETRSEDAAVKLRALRDHVVEMRDLLDGWLAPSADARRSSERTDAARQERAQGSSRRTGTR